MDYFDKTYHPAGTAPGTLISNADVETSEFSIRMINYNNHKITDKIIPSIENCSSYINNESTTWIHINGHINPETLQDIGHFFELHSLAMEDILNSGQRPKMEEYDKQLFIIMNIPVIIENSIKIEQVSLFMEKNLILSFYSGDNDPFDPLRIRINNKNGRLRSKKSDYLLYCLLDLIIDHGYPVLEQFGDKIEDIETTLINSTARQQTLADIHIIKKELLLLLRSIWPQLELMNNLLRDGHELIQKGTLVYLRDCYDHTVQMMELIETYRDMSASMIDIYLSSVSHRLNEVMRILTMIATIFIPLTFIVGLYGMNFSHPESPWAMPELHWYYGYPVIWGVMILIVVGMIIYFRRKKWL